MSYTTKEISDVQNAQIENAKENSSFPVKKWNESTEEEKQERFLSLLDSCRNPVLISPDVRTQ